jgi:hypothetical protein
MATCPTNPTKPPKPAWNPGAECDCPATQTPSPGGPVCRYTWQCYWSCATNNYSVISEIPQARHCIDDCQSDADWHFTARVGQQCFYEINLCSPWECEADPECDNLPPPGGLAPDYWPHDGDEPPHSECGCVPTPTPTDEPTGTPTPTDEPTGTPTPTPTIDPEAYYCMHYNAYTTPGCTGEPFSSGTRCVSGALYQNCWEWTPGVYYYFDAIVSGPWAYPCTGHCSP